MAQVQVAYTVPVYAIVNTEDGTITSVVLNDEAITRAGRESDLYDDGTGPVAEADSEAAEQIAENTIWPVWDRGF